MPRRYPLLLLLLKGAGAAASAATRGGPRDAARGRVWRLGWWRGQHAVAEPEPSECRDTARWPSRAPHVCEPARRAARPQARDLLSHEGGPAAVAPGSDRRRQLCPPARGDAPRQPARSLVCGARRRAAARRPRDPRLLVGERRRRALRSGDRLLGHPALPRRHECARMPRVRRAKRLQHGWARAAGATVPRRPPQAERLPIGHVLGLARRRYRMRALWLRRRKGSRARRGWRGGRRRAPRLRRGIQGRPDGGPLRARATQGEWRHQPAV